MRSTTISRPLIELLVGAFGLWTLICNVTVLRAGSLNQLMWSFLLVGSAVVFFWIKLGVRAGVEPDDTNEAPRDSGQIILVFLVTIAAVTLTLIAHKPDLEDTQWVNWAVTAVDDPSAPLLQSNVNLAPPTPALTPAAYRFHSFELLAAAISRLTGIKAIAVFHLVLAPFAALLTILTSAFALRFISPKWWGAGTLVVFVFLIANGDGHGSWGNFSFVRLHHGKAVFLSTLVPFLVGQGLRFGHQPTWRKGLVLALAQIGGAGLTFTSLIVSPPVVVLAALAGSPKGAREALLRLSVITTSAYPLAAAILVRFSWPQVKRYLPGVSAKNLPSPEIINQAATNVWNKAVEQTHGTGLFPWFTLLILALAWFLAETRAARRMSLLFPLAMALIFVNPLIRPAIMLYATGPYVFWRILWILPLPLLVAVVLISPLSSQRIRRGWMRVGVFVALLIVMFTLIPNRTILSPSNEVRIDWPGLKVGADYQVAVKVRDALPGRANLVGPDRVTTWLTTLHRHPFPLCSWTSYAYQLGPDRKKRLSLKAYVSGDKRPKDGPTTLELGIKRFSLGAVILPVENQWRDEITTVLRRKNFQRFELEGQLELWVMDRSQNEREP